MAYVPVPKDLTKVKSKFIFNLTKRQVICFGLGALVGVPLFFLTKDTIGVSLAASLMIVIMLPFFLFAMFERNGQPLEVLLMHNFKGEASYDKVIGLAKQGLDNDEKGYRREFIRLVETAKGMKQEIAENK